VKLFHNESGICLANILNVNNLSELTKGTTKGNIWGKYAIQFRKINK